MALISRDRAKGIVADALSVVGDFDGDIEQFTFDNFNDFQKQVFLENLAEKIKAAPVIQDNGTALPGETYAIPLSVGALNGWGSMADCIDYILDYITI